MLAKRVCFVCSKPTMKRCSGCQCACFCSAECLKIGWGGHKKMCKLVKAGGTPRVVDDDNLVIDI